MSSSRPYVVLVALVFLALLANVAYFYEFLPGPGAVDTSRMSWEKPVQMANVEVVRQVKPLERMAGAGVVDLNEAAAVGQAVPADGVAGNAAAAVAGAPAGSANANANGAAAPAAAAAANSAASVASAPASAPGVAAAPAAGGAHTLPTADSQCTPRTSVIERRLDPERKSGMLGRHFGQYGQDKKLNELLYKEKPFGVFVEFGAGDGDYNSNTLFFEKTLCWSGLLFEPMADEQKNHYNLRINSVSYNGAVCDREGTRKFTKVAWNGWSGFSDTFSAEHWAGIQRNRYKTEEVDMQCYLLNKELAKYNVATVDLLSVDVEGHELDILESLDYSAVDFQVILVEENGNGAKLSAFLRTKGYTGYIELGSDYAYVKAAYADIAEAAGRLVRI